MPEEVDLVEVRAFLETLEGVMSVHDLHVWAMSTTENALTAHLVMPSGHPGDAFIAEVSHVVRHPLQRIGGFADLLLDGSYGELPEQARAPLLSLACSAHDLTRVVSNVLTHIRLEAHALNVDRRRVAIADLAAEVGYADQAHLSRECVRLTALTPRELLGDAVDRCGCGHDHTASYGPFLAARPRAALTG